MRVIVTRPAADAAAWVFALVQHGFEALPLPLIGIAPAADAAAVGAAWQGLARHTALMFVSGAAVAHFFAKRPLAGATSQDFTEQGMQALPPIWVPGPGTAAALVREGVDAKRITMPAADSAQWDSEALWAQIAPTVRQGDSVLIVRGDQQDGGDSAGAKKNPGVGREWLAAQLVQAGAAVDYLVAYRRVAPVLAPEQRALARAAAQDGALWLFSSAQAVANLRAALPAQPWSAARAMATHPRIAEAARAAGFGVVWQSRPAISEVVASIESIR